MIQNSFEYRVISAHYGSRCAKRSKVPLINHIDEGLIILDAISATDAAKRAYCLHPIVQADSDLFVNYANVAFGTDAYTMMLAMEYRNVANAYLSEKIDTDWPLKLSPLVEVNEMLIADKVQNKKDFMTYHYGSHERSDQLFRYFNKWLDALGIDDNAYQSLCKRINNE